MAVRPKSVALILAPTPAYSRQITEGVIGQRAARQPWRLVDLPHLTVGVSPLPPEVELDGAIVWADRRDLWVGDLVRRGVKVINCGADLLEVPGVVTVRASLREAGKLVSGHLKTIGLRRMILAACGVNERQGISRMFNEIAGSIKDMETLIWDMGGGEDPADSPKRLFEPEKEARLFELMREIEGPTGVFCENDHVGVVVCRVAALAGRRVPEDLAVVGYGDNLVARFSEPPLTSISPPGREIGRRAARLLSRWMVTGEPPAPEHMVEGMALIERESTVGSSGNVILERVRRRIEADSLRGLSVTDLVRFSGLSAKTLVRRYRAAFGVDPADQIRGIRLGEARQLLRRTDLSISQVAAKCGFASQAAFYNFFMRHARMAPSEFRESK